MATLAIRTELFEQGLFPMQAKLSATILINLFTSLNLHSSIDYRIKLTQWVEQAVLHIPGMVASEAEVYFITYRALLHAVEGPSPSSS